MHSIKDVEQNPDLYIANLKKRGASIDGLQQVIELNKERKSLIGKIEEGRASVKKASQSIGQLKKEGKDASEAMEQVKTTKNKISVDEELLKTVEEKQTQLLMAIPNLLAEEVPAGKDEAENKELFVQGDPTKLSFEAKDHVALGENLGMLDFETAAKITGARFVLYKGDLARLERALINFMLDEHGKNGYTEMIPPFIVHERALEGTGQLPKFKDDLFKIEDREWYLIPTSEVPLTNIKREELFPMSELPIRCTAYTPCFRSEAGSYGKDTRGIIRQHQFNKVELVNIVASDQSEQAHEDMVNRARAILDALKLPYRGMLLCSGDTGFGARKTVDIEVWLPGQNKYREISSVSNCWDFQARRASIRYRNADNKPEFAHTLNGSGLAVGRTLVAILENYQQEDGSVRVPEVLRSYMGGQEVIS